MGDGPFGAGGAADRRGTPADLLVVGLANPGQFVVINALEVASSVPSAPGARVDSSDPTGSVPGAVSEVSNAP